MGFELGDASSPGEIVLFSKDEDDFASIHFKKTNEGGYFYSIKNSMSKYFINVTWVRFDGKDHGNLRKELYDMISYATENHPMRIVGMRCYSNTDPHTILPTKSCRTFITPEMLSTNGQLELILTWNRCDDKNNITESYTFGTSDKSKISRLSELIRYDS